MYRKIYSHANSIRVMMMMMTYTAAFVWFCFLFLISLKPLPFAQPPFLDMGESLPRRWLPSSHSHNTHNSGEFDMIIRAITLGRSTSEDIGRFQNDKGMLPLKAAAFTTCVTNGDAPQHET